MKSPNEIYAEHLNRIMTAVTLGTPDRIPVVLMADAFCARHMGMTLKEFISEPEIAIDVQLKSFTSLGEIDGLQAISMPRKGKAVGLWLSKNKRPGIELGDDDLWQVQEVGLMTVEDYDVLIKKGYNKFVEDFMAERLGGDAHEMEELMQHMPMAVKNFADAGIVALNGGACGTPFETFCGGRSMPHFMVDLYRIPDKVQEAMEVAMVDILENVKKIFSFVTPHCFGIGGWRIASEFLSPKLWERFVWPYFKKLAETVIEFGSIPFFHLDSNWERDLDFFLELPKGKCIFSPDGNTDIYRIKEVLGGHMCIAGDVPPVLLSLGTPDEVYNHCIKLIKDIGPSGYILAQGCCIPVDAKTENVKAMISATTGK